MRTALAGLCVVLGVGCNGQALESPTSPTAGAVVSSAQSRVEDAVPFKGSLAATEVDVLAFPTLTVDGSAEGTATHLGRYTATFDARVNVLDGTATGTYRFTAANGDQLFASFSGLGVPAGEGIANITETLAITGGTGRFAGSSGTLVVRRRLDQTTGVSTGSIEGSLR